MKDMIFEAKAKVKDINHEAKARHDYLASRPRPRPCP